MLNDKNSEVSKSYQDMMSQKQISIDNLQHKVGVSQPQAQIGEICDRSQKNHKSNERPQDPDEVTQSHLCPSKAGHELQGVGGIKPRPSYRGEATERSRDLRELRMKPRIHIEAIDRSQSIFPIRTIGVTSPRKEKWLTAGGSSKREAKKRKRKMADQLTGSFKREKKSASAEDENVSSYVSITGSVVDPE